MIIDFAVNFYILKIKITKNIFLLSLFFFWIRGNPTPWKTHFVGSDERVKPRLSQALTRGARPDSNSRLPVQISNLLSSRYVPWGLFFVSFILI